MERQKNNSWGKHELHVMETLDRLETGQKDMAVKLTKVRVSIEGLRVKAGFWGLIGGSLPVIAFVLLKVFA